jgi:hypothetical protein
MIKFLKLISKITIVISYIIIGYLIVKIFFEYFKETINTNAGFVAVFFSLFFFYCFVIGFNSLPIILRLRNWQNDGEFSNDAARGIFNSIIKNINQTIITLIQSDSNLKLFENRALLEKFKDGLIVMTTLNTIENISDKGIFKFDDYWIPNNEYYGLKYSLMRELKYWERGSLKGIEAFNSIHYSTTNLGLLTISYVLKNNDIELADKQSISSIGNGTADNIGIYIREITYLCI